MTGSTSTQQHQATLPISRVDLCKGSGDQLRRGEQGHLISYPFAYGW